MPIIRVDDPDDPRLAEFAIVRRPRALREAGLFAAEGRRVVRTALALPRWTVRRLLLEPSAHAALAADLARDAPSVPVVVAPGEAMARVGGYRFSGGALALAERVPAPEAASLLGAATGPLVGLDAVTDPDNVGSLFRSAHALGAGGMLLGPRCADPLFRKTLRVSVGAVLQLPFAEVTGWAAVLDAARDRGWRVVALTPDARLELRGWPVPERVLLVLGNEGEGVSAALRARVDVALRIPMSAGADSLNVAVSGALALWHCQGERNVADSV